MRAGKGGGTNRLWGGKVRRAVGDSDAIRRQNRGLVLDTLRRSGPLSRTELARRTGLSHATITAIVSDFMAQGILTDLQAAAPASDDEPAARRGRRGRPAIRVDFARSTAFVLLAEIDVSRMRMSMIDQDGTLVDRIETALGPESFVEEPPIAYLSAAIEQMRRRNPGEADRIVSLSASVQGILDRRRQALEWSPVNGLAGHDLVAGILRHAGIPTVLIKRGQLLAEGSRWLFPELRDANVATVFVGSTVAMGMSFRGGRTDRKEDAATEFGHMIHLPDGALCRCGMRGCIEAYAADYGVLRTAYGVPATTSPAPAVPPDQYARLIEAAGAGNRDTLHAFNLAGSAIGYGLNRLMAVFDPSHVMIVGPGAGAYEFMKSSIENALAASLTARVQGTPAIRTHGDETEPVFAGLKMKALNGLDQSVFAALPAAAHREET